MQSIDGFNDVRRQPTVFVSASLTYFQRVTARCHLLARAHTRARACARVRGALRASFPSPDDHFQELGDLLQRLASAVGLTQGRGGRRWGAKPRRGATRSAAGAGGMRGAMGQAFVRARCDLT